MQSPSIRHLPPQAASQEALFQLQEALRTQSEALARDGFFVLTDSYRQLAEGWLRIAEVNLRDYCGRRAKETDDARQALLRMLTDFRRLTAEFQKQTFPKVEQSLGAAFTAICLLPQEWVAEAPESLWTLVNKEQLAPQPGEHYHLRTRKQRIAFRGRLTGYPLALQQPYRECLYFRLETSYLPQMFSLFEAAGMAIFDWIEKCSQWAWRLARKLDIALYDSQPDSDPDTLVAELKRLIAFLSSLQDKLSSQSQAFSRQLTERLTADLEQPALSNYLTMRMRNMPVTSKTIGPVIARWKKRMALFQQQFDTDLALAALFPYLSGLNQQLTRDIESRMFDPAHEAIHDLKRILSDQLAGRSAGAFPHIPELPLGVGNLVTEELTELARPALEKLPETVLLFRDQSRLDALAGKPDFPETVAIPLAEMVNYELKTLLEAPLARDLTTLMGRLKKDFLRIQDVARLMSIAWQSRVAHHKNETDAERKAAFDKATDLLLQAENGLKESREFLRVQLQQHGQDVLQNLNSRSIIIQAVSLKRDLRQERRIEGVLQSWRAFQNKAAVWRERWQLWYETSTQALEREPQLRLMDLGKALLQAMTARQPKPEVWNKLPFYYKQLFIGRQVPGRTRLRHREREHLEAEAAYAQYLRRAGGGMLIVGDGYAGKTHFSEHFLISQVKSTIYRVNPPESDDIPDADALFEAFREAVGSGTYWEELISMAPQGSVFFIDDLEKWWERTSLGQGAILQLVQLIQTYSKDYLFIGCCNPYFGSLLLESDSGFRTAFPSRIVMGRLSMPQLKDLVLSRHYSGGMQIQLEGEPAGNELPPGVFTRLFNRYRATSGGLAGLALRQWLTHIAAVQEDTLWIKEPQWKALPEIKEPNWLVVLAQFLLHKELSVDQLSRVIPGEDVAQIHRWISQMVWSGLLEWVNEKTLVLNPWTGDDIARQVLEAGLLQDHLSEKET